MKKTYKNFIPIILPGAAAADGTFLCAASREQAERAVSYIGENCRLIEADTSDHVIHTVHKDFYIEAVNSMYPAG